MKRFLIPYNIGFDYSFALEFITKLLSCISCLSLSLSLSVQWCSLSLFLSLIQSKDTRSLSLSFSRLRVPMFSTKCRLPFQSSIFNDSLCLSFHIQVITVGQGLFSLCCAFILQLALFLSFSLSLFHSLSFFHSLFHSLSLSLFHSFSLSRVNLRPKTSPPSSFKAKFERWASAPTQLQTPTPTRTTTPTTTTGSAQTSNQFRLPQC